MEAKVPFALVVTASLQLFSYASPQQLHQTHSHFQGQRDLGVKVGLLDSIVNLDSPSDLPPPEEIEFPVFLNYPLLVDPRYQPAPAYYDTAQVYYGPTQTYDDSSESYDYNSAYDDYSSEYYYYNSAYDDYSSEYDDYNSAYDDYSSADSDNSEAHDDTAPEYAYSQTYDNTASAADWWQLPTVVTNDRSYQPYHFQALSLTASVNRSWTALDSTALIRAETAVPQLRIIPSISINSPRQTCNKPRFRP